MKKFLDKYCDLIIKKVKPIIVFNLLIIMDLFVSDIVKWKYDSYFSLIIIIFLLLEFIVYIPIMINLFVFWIREDIFDKGKKRKE